MSGEGMKPPWENCECQCEDRAICGCEIGGLGRMSDGTARRMRRRW